MLLQIHRILQLCRKFLCAMLQIVRLQSESAAPMTSDRTGSGEADMQSESVPVSSSYTVLYMFLKKLQLSLIDHLQRKPQN